MAPRNSRVLAAALLLAAPLLGVWAGLAAAQAPTGGDPAVEDKTATSRFRCQDGGDLQAQFVTQHGRLVAIVDAFDGDGPHTLAGRPYDGPPVRLTWSDGRRTLTWSPGVQIMWMAADVHRMCGRPGHHH
ncbi:MAG: hypothetical protein JWP28_2476 [Phenylobacterium sp.]|uniref:hypothetical protein n=1 Tax=Phenylobacterium sp. TaxID=1871053 RepID=UPI002634B150|nr:hypothetical protein [Phenylobacterium sp.]MDB5498445.1 hypothetical protein [Phenylobacterium sp.]